MIGAICVPSHALINNNHENLDVVYQALFANEATLRSYLLSIYETQVMCKNTLCFPITQEWGGNLKVSCLHNIEKLHSQNHPGPEINEENPCPY